MKVISCAPPRATKFKSEMNGLDDSLIGLNLWKSIRSDCGQLMKRQRVNRTVRPTQHLDVPGGSKEKQPTVTELQFQWQRCPAENVWNSFRPD